jgi:multidrug resistance efflux pump
MLKRSLLRHAVPVMVWLAATGAVVWMFYQRTQQFEIVGIARGEVRQVASGCTGRIVSISVRLFQPVKKGQTLAVINTVLDNEQTIEAELKTQLATAAAEAERLTALLIPTQEQLRTEMANLELGREDNQRRFDVDAETARLRILELQAAIASDVITRDDLTVQMKVNDELLKDELIAPYEVERTKAQHDSTAKRIEENERLVEQTKVVLRQAEQRRAQFIQLELPKQSVDDALEAIRKEVRVQEATMKGVLEQLAALQSRRAVELTSPIDGVVIPIPGQDNDMLHQRPGEQVLRRAGEVVVAGDPILAVSQQQPTEIVAYISEQQLGLWERQATVEVVKTRMPAQIALAAEVLQIGPTIELMPQRLWRNPAIPQWGLPVLITIPAGLDLVPGEVVGIRRS